MTDKLQRDARLAKWLVTIPLALLGLLARNRILGATAKQTPRK